MEKTLESADRQFAAKQFEEAAIGYRKALQLDPKSGEAHLGLARIMMQGQGSVEVYKELKLAVALAPKNKEARKLLTDLALAAYLRDERRPQELYATLQELAKTALSEEAEGFEGWRISGWLAKTDRRQTEAIQAFRRALRAKPADGEVTRGLAEVLLEDPQSQKEGERVLDELITAQPKDALTYDALYKHLMAKGRVEEAEQLLERKITANPGMGIYVTQLATAYRAHGKTAAGDSLVANMAADGKQYADGRLEAGNYHALAKEWDKALGYYRGGWTQGGGRKVEYGKRMVSALNSLGKPDEAQKIVQEALALDGTDVELRTVRALLALERKNASDAATELSELARTNPSNAAIQYHLGRALAMTGDRKKAAAAWRQAIQAQPRFVDPRLALARQALEAGQQTDALAIAEEAVALEPGNAAALLLRVGILQYSGDLEKAKTALRSLQGLYPELPGLDVERAHLDLRQGRYGDAERTFRKRYVPGDEDLRVLFGFTRALVGTGKAAEAVALLEAELRRFPKRAELQYVLAETYLVQRQTAKALPVLRTLHADHPEFWAGGMRLADLQIGAGDAKAAVETMRRTAAAVPERVEVTNLLARAHEASGDWEAAKSTYREALRKNDKNLYAKNGLANLIAEHGNDGELAEALRLAQEAKAAAPRDPNIIDTVGLIFLRQKNKAAAAQLFREALQIAPGNAQMKAHLEKALESR